MLDLKRRKRLEFSLRSRNASEMKKFKEFSVKKKKLVNSKRS